jgi:hypothetical protein
MGLTMSVCPSVNIVYLENRWTDLDETWYGRYAIDGFPKLVLSGFLHSVIPTWRSNELVSWDRH